MNITYSNFCKLRKESNIKQSAIALELKISQPLISLWENGTRTPPIELLPKLAEILHCSIEELVLALIETKQTYTRKLNKKSKLGG